MRYRIKKNQTMHHPNLQAVDHLAVALAVELYHPALQDEDHLAVEDEEKTTSPVPSETTW
jgi:hypothetical protein